jgi:hypothetical protein
MSSTLINHTVSTVAFQTRFAALLLKTYAANPQTGNHSAILKR